MMLKYALTKLRNLKIKLAPPLPKLRAVKKVGRPQMNKRKAKEKKNMKKITMMGSELILLVKRKFPPEIVVI